MNNNKSNIPPFVRYYYDLKKNWFEKMGKTVSESHENLFINVIGTVFFEIWYFLKFLKSNKRSNEHSLYTGKFENIISKMCVMHFGKILWKNWKKKIKKLYRIAESVHVLSTAMAIIMQF